MKQQRRLLIILLLVTVLIGVVSYNFFKLNRNPNELLLYGNVDVREVDISFRVPGQIVYLAFEEGDFVSKGSLMATLDKEPYNEQLKQASAQLLSIQTNLRNADVLYKRRQQLSDIGGVSQEDIDNSESNYLQLKANEKAAQAALEIAKENMSYISTYAPNDGVVLTRIREPGSVVKAADPVFTLSLTNPVWIRAYVSEPYLGSVIPGMEAEIFTDTPGRPSYKGKVGFISPMAEFTPKTVETTQLRTDLVYRLRIYVDNPDQGLRLGMPVTVRLNLDSKI